MRTGHWLAVPVWRLPGHRHAPAPEPAVAAPAGPGDTGRVGTPTWDLIVAGAGPAGTAAALEATRLAPGARVLLLDRAAFPRDKPCGDGIGPHAAGELAALGVTSALDGYPPLRRLRLRAPGGIEVAGTSTRPSWVVPRRVLDARLVAAAIGAGAAFRRERMRSLEEHDGLVVVNGSLAGRVVIGADGANSRLRSLLPHAEPDPASLRAHHLPFSSHRPRIGTGRVLLCGDAASMVNPLSGEGIYYALASGRLAARAALLWPDRPGPVYRALLRGSLGRHFRHAAVLARAIRCQPLARAALAAADSPTRFQRLVELGLGQVRITPALLGSVLAGWRGLL